MRPTPSQRISIKTGPYNMKILIVFFALLLVVCIEGRKKVLCLQDIAEPTLLEVLSAALPFNISLNTAEHLQDEDRDIIQLPVWRKVLNIKVPIMSLFSSGNYIVKFSNNNFIAQDVLLVQESFAAFNIPCQLSYHLNIPYLRGWCSCSNDAVLTVKDWAGVPLPHTYSEYCLADPPCSVSDYTEGSCRVFVADPFRTSCIVIDGPSTAIVPNSVEYEITTPSVREMLPSTLEEAIKKLDIIEPNSLVEKSASVLTQSLSALLAAIPVHALFLVIGLILTVYSKDLAENVLIQTFIQSTLGLSLALLVLGFILYRPIEKIVSRYGGIVTIFFPYSVLTSFISLVYRNPVVGWKILGLFYSFWEDGAFGIPWIGKVYFLGSIGLSYGVCWYFQWFDSDSRMWPVIQFIVRGVGLAFLANSSSSRDLAFLMVLMGLIVEQVWPYVEFLLLLWEAYRQPKHSPEPLVRSPIRGKKSSADELAELTRKSTQEALEKLRLHLQENQSDLHKVTNKLLQAGNKNQEAMLVDKFVKGAYSGLPQDSEEELPKRSWLRSLASTAMRLLAVVLAIGALWVVALLLFR